MVSIWPLSANSPYSSLFIPCAYSYFSKWQYILAEEALKRVRHF